MDNHKYKKIKDYLNKCADNNYLSNAYIFYGPDESVKKKFALNFARRIINSEAEFHPDLMLISSVRDEELSINIVRQLKKFLILSPYSGKYKVAIVERAEKLNYYSKNAILKVFEEAPHRSIIILCANTIDSFPKTISSRGVKIPFWQQSTGQPLIDENMVKNFENVLNDKFKKQYLYIEKFSNFKAIEIFEMWLNFLRNKFLLSSGNNNKLAKILKISQNIYFKLDENNINPKLAYDELILNLWRS